MVVEMVMVVLIYFQMGVFFFLCIVFPQAEVRDIFPFTGLPVESVQEPP